MATILKQNYKNDTIDGTLQPIIYVDSVNDTSYIKEMYSIIVKYIRQNNMNINKNNDDQKIVKKTNHMANDYNDIYYNKKDGYWIIFDDKNKSVTLYIKQISTGFIYNSYSVNKIFTLSYVKCPRIVPLLFDKKDKHGNFLDELKFSVKRYRQRRTGAESNDDNKNND